MATDHFVYILKCSDKSLYTGYTNNLESRLRVHNSGKGAKYTRARCPVEYVYIESFKDKSTALKREYEIKQLDRQQKIKLIRKVEKIIGEKLI